MFLAIDIGGSTIQYAQFDESYTMKQHWTVLTPDLSNAQSFYNYIYNHAKDSNLIKGVAIAAPGVIEENGYIATRASDRIHPLFQTNIINEMEKRFNRPVSALNDAKAAGLCELELGAAKGSSSSATFIIGTGIGGAISYKDNLIFGHDSFAGEFSSIPLIIDKEIVSLSWVASADALVQAYNQKTGKKLKYAKPIFDAYHQSEQDAVAIFEEWIEYIVLGLIQISSIYNPQIICIGGGVSQDPILIKKIRSNYFRRVKKMFKQDVFSPEIVLCKYPQHANLYGAMIHHKKKFA